MNVIHLSDFNCIYSYIGLNRMKNTVSKLNLDVEWEMKSFELEPNANNTSAMERFAIDNGLSVDDAEKEIESIEEIAKNEGLNVNYRDMAINSSKDAHRLAKYVQNRYPELAQELIFKIFESNFIKNENIADHDVLIKIAASLGLDENEISEMLKKESLQIEVELDMDEALSYGITRIPYYIIEYKGERLTIPGVFEKEDLETAFKDMLSGKIKDKSYLGRIDFN
ncbi:MAG: DsbA family protein [Methanobrevibacter sp.]|nr:DsbA family protein [Methanobrevibacter sp.]